MSDDFPVPSRHAVRRYIDRVKPLATFDVARYELESLIAQGRCIEWPTWAHTEREEEDDTVLELVDGIVLVVRGNVAITLLTRGGYHPAAREYRTRQRKKAKKQARVIEKARHSRKNSVWWR